MSTIVRDERRPLHASPTELPASTAGRVVRFRLEKDRELMR
jgi:hypothetical protein